MEFRLGKTETVAEETADFIINILNEGMKNSSKKILVGLSGGNSPIALYKNIDSKMSPSLSKRIIFIQIDERVVNIEHKDSNQRLIRECFVNALNCGAMFLPIPVEQGQPLAIADAYDMSVREAFGISSFSLAILGAGTDGHTASIFPNEQSIANTNNFVFASATEHNGYERISLSYKALYSFSKSIMYVPGEQKLEIVDLIQDKKNKDKYPAARFMNTGKNTILIASQ